MKNGLKVRPVFYWAVYLIHAHIAITELALLLERVVKHACQETKRNIRDNLKRIQLVQLSSPDGMVLQVTEATPAATNRLKLLNPPPVLDLRLRNKKS